MDVAREPCLNVRSKIEEWGEYFVPGALYSRSLGTEKTKDWSEKVNVCNLTQCAGVRPGPSCFFMSTSFLPLPRFPVAEHHFLCHKQLFLAGFFSAPATEKTNTASNLPSLFEIGTATAFNS